MAGELEEDVFSGKLNLQLWRKLSRFLRPYRVQVGQLVLLAMLVAACDVALPILTGKVVQAVRDGGGTEVLWPYAVGYAAAFCVLAGCIFCFIMVCGQIAVGVSADVREATFDKLQRLQFAYYDKRNVGWLMARLTSDCNSLSRVAAWGLLDITWGTTVLISMAVAMFILNWQLALIVCGIAPILFLASWFFQVRLLKTSRQMRKTNSLLTGAFNEGIVGVKTTKSLVREERNLEEFQNLSGRMFEHAIRNATYSALFIPTVGLVCSIGVAMALWNGGGDVVSRVIEVGLLVTFLQYAQHIAGPAQELANTITMVQNAQASAERIQGVIDEPVTIEDSPEVAARIDSHSPLCNGHAIDGGSKSIREVRFENVTFGYDPKTPVLHDFSLCVRAGQTVALVGATGGGKSTIVSLVCRFYEPTSGRILFDGVDYRQRSLAWLQGSLGIVLQQPHLFSGTIRENIRYGRLNATDDEVVAAAKLTNAHAFIEKFRDGYDTNVGEGGNQLSTGQKQLISLARAVIADPQIFVMDEATSSVDTQTERDIQTAVERILAGRIAFVIAHRLSTIRNADIICVIDQGRVIEQGNHHELIRKRGRYFELYTNQFVQEHEEGLMRGQK